MVNVRRDPFVGTQVKRSYRLCVALHCFNIKYAYQYILRKIYVDRIYYLVQDSKAILWPHIFKASQLSDVFHIKVLTN